MLARGGNSDYARLITSFQSRQTSHRARYVELPGDVPAIRTADSKMEPCGEG
jgi:hypothetical protein